MKNEYPEQIIDKNIKKYLQEKQDNFQKNKTIENCKYFKLPYIKDFSDFADKKFKQLKSQFCKSSTTLKIAFTPTKLSSFFSLKDKMPNALKSHVVYKFICAGCNASYIGYTTRYLTTRIDEHFNKSGSHINQHFKNSKGCREKCSANCFKAIDKAPSEYSLMVKECIWIKELKPTLNIQHKNQIKFSIYI
jgi:hypothetical protein